MNNVTEALIAQLITAFVDMDTRVLAETQKWAAERKAAMTEFKKTARLVEMGSHAYYTTLFTIAGGKTWYRVFDGRNLEMIQPLVAKHCADVAASRNASITNKLLKAEISTVVSSDFQRTRDGFNGLFVVETNKGRKIVKIETIYAGGYNIQCLHLRTLINVK